MAKRRKATPVALTDKQRERLERLWFYYGNYGPQATPGNHQFIQGLLEHGLDLRPLQTKRTPKSERPTPECEAAVEAVLAASGGDAEEGTSRPAFLQLIPSPDGERKPGVPEPELKSLLDEMRRRQTSGRGRGGLDAGGKDAA
jgi:hypothetical protein